MHCGNRPEHSVDEKEPMTNELAFFSFFFFFPFSASWASHRQSNTERPASSGLSKRQTSGASSALSGISGLLKKCSKCVRSLHPFPSHFALSAAWTSGLGSGHWRCEARGGLFYQLQSQ